jgi:hypothetical protein
MFVLFIFVGQSSICNVIFFHKSCDLLNEEAAYFLGGKEQIYNFYLHELPLQKVILSQTISGEANEL